jgi:ABC-type branched-subunit amino acid transport system substrate-binding protein
MPPCPDRTRRSLLGLGGGLLLAALAACTQPKPPAPGPGVPVAPTTVPGPATDPAAPVPVALLVPLGSADPDRNRLGQSLVNAARLAQGDLRDAAVDLRIYETGGDPDRAAAAAARAVAEGARIIVGPLFGQEAQAVGPVAAASGINVLTFSTTSSVAGRNVFLLGLTAETEADRILAWARTRGVNSVAVFYPQSPSGAAAERAVRAAAARLALGLAPSMEYPRSFQGIQDRARDYAGVHAADAVVLPDGGQGLVSVAAFLAYYNVNPARTKYLGLGQWNAAVTLKEPALAGGWFVAPDPELFAAFAARYRGAWGADPSPVASLGYDGIAAVGALIRAARASGESDPFAVARLTDPGGFAGVSGIFRLRGDGSIERALAVMEVGPDGFVVVDPAPKRFVGPTS